MDEITIFPDDSNQCPTLLFIHGKRVYTSISGFKIETLRSNFGNSMSILFRVYIL